MGENHNKESYLADKPVKALNDDRFQRYGFAKRIADTIINRKNKESIVFGLFGAWGEGKTSVLNFIDHELKKDESIISIHLNPWRYSDEDSLLKNFFEKIAQALGKELEKKTEKIGDFIKKHGSLTSVFGLDITGVGNILNDVKLETFKERIDEFLDASENKIVIFVDDIDRLDKQEIYTLFRLVKLTADFTNTIYILSFDEAMVAAAIGERFGSGDKTSGTSFLEKIIQVPLTIPKAQPDALKKFCFQLVDNALNSSKISLSEEEVQRFVYQFSTHVLGRLNTPRFAVRYGNTLSFSLPLLKGEANVIDLMLIEAVKIFYPNHYLFIKNNPDYFIGSYKSFGSETDNQKIIEIKEKLDRLGSDLNSSEKESVRYLLSNLFPVLDTALGNYQYSNESHNDWYVQKRIVSTKYFDRFFTYAVIEGDISDIEFEELLKNVMTTSVEENSTKVSEIIKKSNAGNLIQKLRSKETVYTWEESQQLAKALCCVTDLLPNEGGMLGFGFENPTGQAAIFIYQLLKNHQDKDIFQFAKELMTFPKDFRFAYNINNWLRSGERQEEKLFSLEQYQELAKILTKRAINEAGEESIFEKFPDNIHYLIQTWFERDQTGFTKYVKDYLNKDNDKVLQLLKALVPLQRSSARKGEYKTDISKKQFEYIVSYFDKEDLHVHILNNYTIEEIEAGEPYWIDMSENQFTELNMVRQFYRWYSQEKDEEADKKLSSP